MPTSDRREYWVQPLAFAVMVTLGLIGVNIIQGDVPQFFWIVGAGVVGALVGFAVPRMVRRFRRNSRERGR
jgi:hypothetical protein